VFSPDGKHLAYRAQKRPGFEADKWELILVECDAGGAFKGKPRSLTAKHDRAVGEYAWIPNEGGKTRILYSTEETANTIYYIANLDDADGYVTIYNRNPYKGTQSALSVSADGSVRAYLTAHLFSPAEIYTTGKTGAFRRNPVLDDFNALNVSQANTKLLDELDLPKPESVEVEIDGGKMQMWILKPPGFDEKKKWPLAYLVHGGPQGAWEDGWSYRWCPELWAAQGYVVALPNPRGSTGFGQKFVDEISGDWGGKCYDDLMKGVDYMEKLPYIDKERMGAAGASFGGYMMNWFAVNTGRFKCLITHCSVWNFESMFATTDELWFDEWEHGGLPWDKPEAYAKFSPHKKAANLGKFKTPMLIIHNDNDFRCPIGQGLELFTCLQRQRVPSRFLNFPDESHWVLKPKNSERWHKEVFAWLTKYVPPGGR
jgi:dipeptidyl aminopeptidase/acylaminoacyl peptidase